MDKITPKNNSFYQEFIALYGTFAIPENGVWIIDKSGLGTVTISLRPVQEMPGSQLLKLAKKIQKEL